MQTGLQGGIFHVSHIHDGAFQCGRRKSSDAAEIHMV